MESFGARSVHVLGSVFVLVVTGFGCGNDSPSGPSKDATLSESEETASIVFHYSPGDSVQAAREQAFHDWAVGVLGVSPTRKVSFNKYLSRNQMGRVTGVSNTNAFADPSQFALHTIFSFDNHEPVHLYTSLFGQAVGLFNEGIAVAFQTDPAANDFVPRWSGEPVHDVARRFQSQGSLAPIPSMLTTSDFLLVTDNVRYPEAGSFVRYLLDTYGLEPMKAFFRLSSAEDPAEKVRDHFEQVFGTTVDQASDDWLRFLETM